MHNTPPNTTYVRECGAVGWLSVMSRLQTKIRIKLERSMIVCESSCVPSLSTAPQFPVEALPNENQPQAITDDWQIAILASHLTCCFPPSPSSSTPNSDAVGGGLFHDSAGLVPRSVPSSVAFGVGTSNGKLSSGACGAAPQRNHFFLLPASATRSCLLHGKMTKSPWQRGPARALSDGAWTQRHLRTA